MVAKKVTSKKSSKNLKKKRGISKLQALILVGVLAVIGVVAVVLSHASGTPLYQYSYSAYCVSAYGSSSATEVQNCKDTSSEALVYRLYQGILGKSPDYDGYKYWTQKLAGDRMKSTELALVTERVAKLGLASGSTESQSSDTAFVKAVYKNMFDREPKDSELVAWRNKLKAEGAKRLTREKMIVQIAVSRQAITKYREPFNKYTENPKTPRVAVVQTAANDQRKRFDAMLTDYQQPAKKDMERAADLVTKAQAQLDNASTIASKKQASITPADLESIKANQSTAQGYYNSAKNYATDAANKEKAAARLRDRAQAVANFSTDIKDNTVYGMSKISDRYNAVKLYSATAGNKPQLIKSKIDSIAAKYTLAEKKYKDEQARILKKHQDDINKVLSTVHNENCYKYSYTVIDFANFKQDERRQYLYHARDVVVSGKGPGTIGCNYTSSGFNYYALYNAQPKSPNGPHYPVRNKDSSEE